MYMFFKSLVPGTGPKIGKWLLVIAVAGCAGCNRSNEDLAATSPVPTVSPGKSNPAPATKAILTLSSGTGFNGVTQGANVKIAPSAQGLVVQALTTDPSIVLPRFAVSDAKPLSVHIQYLSPGATNSQIFYDTKAHGDNWDEAHSIRRPVAKGENDVTVTITDANFGGRIRFDPGDLAGDYVIKLIEIRP
jgi:hypothetical protein